MVLWHTEVEQQKPADIAPLLGMSANSVSALAYRAREGLRQAFLSQHADRSRRRRLRLDPRPPRRLRPGRPVAPRRRPGRRPPRRLPRLRRGLPRADRGQLRPRRPARPAAARRRGRGYLSSTGGGAASVRRVATGFAAAKGWVARPRLADRRRRRSRHRDRRRRGLRRRAPGRPHGRRPRARPRAWTAARSPTSSLDRVGHRGPNGITPHGGNPGSVGPTDRTSPGPATPPTTPSTTPPRCSRRLHRPPAATRPAPTDGPTDRRDPTDPTTGPTDPTTGPTDPSRRPITFDSTPPGRPGDRRHLPGERVGRLRRPDHLLDRPGDHQRRLLDRRRPRSPSTTPAPA